MPTNAPPQGVINDLSALGAALDGAVPPTIAPDLLIATWNIRAVGDLTQSWRSGPGEFPKRDWHAIGCIA